MYELILILHVLIAVCIIILVLIQQGKGATAGASFGGGASQTVFGSRGSGAFLLKVTIGFAILFFGTSIVLNYMATKAVRQQKELTLPTPAETQKSLEIPSISPSSLPATVPVGQAANKKLKP